MTLAFQSMLLSVLLVCAAIAALPLQLFTVEPRLSSPLRPALSQPGVWVVENPRGQWFVNGALRSKDHVGSMLKKEGSTQVVHYLPSDALQLSQIKMSLRWLRSLAPNAVVLELAPQQFSSSP